MALYPSGRNARCVFDLLVSALLLGPWLLASCPVCVCLLACCYRRFGEPGGRGEEESWHDGMQTMMVARECPQNDPQPKNPLLSAASASGVPARIGLVGSKWKDTISVR